MEFYVKRAAIYVKRAAINGVNHACMNLQRCKSCIKFTSLINENTKGSQNFSFLFLLAFAVGHTTMNIPDPFRTPKSSVVRPG